MERIPDMTADTLASLPMTMGYFRLLLRRFGDTPERRAAILAGTGLSEAALADPSADISLSQQVRQLDNLNAMLGEGWALGVPELWNPASHGSVGVATLTARDLDAAMAVIVRYGRVRAPYSRVVRRRAGASVIFEHHLTVPLEVSQWRTLREISFMGLHSLIATIRGRPLETARYLFACPEPAHADRVRQALRSEVVYDAAVTAMELPAAVLSETSSLADPALHARTVEELDRAMLQAGKPRDVRERVEQLLSTQPAGRLDADTAARMLGLSRRTLVRRLAESGVGYRQLIDNALERRAALLIDAGGLSHAEIAERLGYADATSFSRSLRRWRQPPG